MPLPGTTRKLPAGKDCWLGSPVVDLVPRPQGMRDVAIFVIAKVRGSTTRRSNTIDGSGSLLVYGAKAAWTFCHQHCRRKRIQASRLKQLRCEMRARARRHNNPHL